jgi:hypothetical protein
LAARAAPALLRARPRAARRVASSRVRAWLQAARHAARAAQAAERDLGSRARGSKWPGARAAAPSGRPRDSSGRGALLQASGSRWKRSTRGRESSGAQGHEQAYGLASRRVNDSILPYFDCLFLG